MRSPRAFAGGLIPLLGAPLALITSMAFGEGAETVIHLALAASFLSLALAVFDFKLPTWIGFAACGAAAALAAIFLLQAVGDLAHSASLRRLAYDVLGQRLEKILGYVFLFWCVAMLMGDSAGRTRIFGGIVLGSIFCVEVYGVVTTYAGGETPGFLKLLYLPLFVWLLLEGMKPRASRSGAG